MQSASGRINSLLYDVAAIEAALNRNRAAMKNKAPMPAVARKAGQTTSNPAPRYRIAWAKDTKCVEGTTCMMVDSQTGMLSSGVLVPDSMFIGIAISM